MPNPITLRFAAPADAKALLAIYAPYVKHTAITFEYDVPTVSEFADRIRHTLTRYPYLAAERDGKIVGYAYASAFHSRKAYSWCAEVSIYVEKSEQHTGVGGKLYRALEAILKLQNVLNLYACVASPPVEDEYLTDASIRFHAHMGYRQIAAFRRCGYKFDRWYDMVWMEKLLADPQSPQSEVIPFPQIQGQAKDFL